MSALQQQLLAGRPALDSAIRMQIMAGLDNGNTSIIDASSYARAMTPTGVMQNSTVLTVFGRSMYSSAGAGSITTPYADDMKSGTQDFTLDGWIANRSGASTTYANFLESSFPYHTFILGHNVGANKLCWWIRFNGSSWGLQLNEPGTSMAPGTLRFVSCTRSGDNYYLHIDGTLAASGTLSGSINTAFTGDALITLLPFTASYYGHGGPLRYTIGVARYSASNYTPPTEVFPT